MLSSLLPASDPHSNPPPTQSTKGKEKASDQNALASRRETDNNGLYYRPFISEEVDLGHLVRLIEEELSEPYTVWTYRYFLSEWPHLTLLVFPHSTSSTPVGTIICKQESHRGKTNRGYIGMLSVDKAWRRRGIASTLVKMAIDIMIRRGAHEIVLETEFDNSSSLALYGALGFIREKRLQRFYSNGKDAFRLILPVSSPNGPPSPDETDEEAEEGRWAISNGPDESLHRIDEDDEMKYGYERREEWGTPRPKVPPLPDRPDWYT